MQALLLGFEHVKPQKKAPFTMLHIAYQKHGAHGKVTEQIYVPDGFPLPRLTPDMILDVDRDGKGFLLAVAEASQAQSLKLSK